MIVPSNSTVWNQTPPTFLLRVRALWSQNRTAPSIHIYIYIYMHTQYIHTLRLQVHKQYTYFGALKSVTSYACFGRIWRFFGALWGPAKASENRDDWHLRMASEHCPRDDWEEALRPANWAPKGHRRILIVWYLLYITKYGIMCVYIHIHICVYTVYGIYLRYINVRIL